jgi:hypothetical protein
VSGNTNPSANEDLASRFVLDVLDDDVLDDAGTVAEIKKLNLPSDLLQASQEDFKSLTRIFDWAESVIGHVGGTVYHDGELIFERGHSPRFCDFLVVDERALRSLAALPGETPPLHIVSREERFVGSVLSLCCLLRKIFSHKCRPDASFMTTPMFGSSIHRLSDPSSASSISEPFPSSRTGRNAATMAG